MSSDKKPDKPHLRVISAIDNAETLAANPAPSGDDRGNDPGDRDAADHEPSRGEGGEPGRKKRAKFGKDGISHAELDLQLARYQCTDLGNAKRFVKRHGDQFLHVPEWGWLAWDGRRWATTGAAELLDRAVYETVEAIKREALALEASPLDVLLQTKRDGTEVWASDRVMGWYVASQSNSHIGCIANLAKAFVSATADQFDADPSAINVLNGTLRVSKHATDDYVRFSSHNPKDLITKLAHATYDPSSSAPAYDAFLSRVQPDQKMRRHLHAWGGLSFTGLQVARLSFWYGTGRNGKSTLVDTWAHVMGDYAQTIPIESFLDQGRARRGGEASPDIASLVGIRALRTSEPERGSKLAEGLIKLVTGGEPMRARHLNKDFFEFRPCFKLTMQGNYKPRVDGTDEGLWARLLIVPWQVMIPEDERDPALPGKLRAEASGILNQLLDGLRDYLDHGLSPPDQVIEATQEYREQSDPIGRFLAECCDLSDPRERADAMPLYATYAAWAKSEGEAVWTVRGFSRGLQEHGMQRMKSGTIVYLGLKLVKTPAYFEGLEIHDQSEKRR